jgi:hypothetical protein
MLWYGATNRVVKYLPLILSFKKQHLSLILLVWFNNGDHFESSIPSYYVKKKSSQQLPQGCHFILEKIF